MHDGYYTVIRDGRFNKTDNNNNIKNINIGNYNITTIHNHDDVHSKCLVVAFSSQPFSLQGG